jgi:hypothetical protein
MSVTSRSLSFVLEKLLNVLEKDYIQTFYGEGTYLKIRDIVFSPVKNKCMVDCVVILGDTIDMTVLEEDMTRLLVLNMMDKLVMNYHVSVMVSYDV